MIREVTYEELKSIYDIGTNPFRKFFVYEEDQTILGYFVIDVIYERMELIYIYVEEKNRNRKIGANMLQYICLLASEKKVCNITLEVKTTNKYAIKLYEKFGFKQVALRKAYYNGEDGLLMELLINC